MERTLAQREGLRRGWLTYSELVQLLPSFTLMKFLLNNLAVLAISYAASVFTIAGAFFIASQVPGTLWHRPANTTSTAATTTTNGVNTTQMTTPILHTVNGNGDEISIGGGGGGGEECCSALNVEAELLKLEQQICAEERLFELQRRQRLERPPNPLLPPNYRMEYAATPQQDHTQHWLNIKSQYSDDVRHNLNRNQQHHHYHAQNASVFWQLLSDAMSQPSFLVRWPELWPKLI